MENVTDHEHFFPESRPWSSEDETRRFDACLLNDGSFVVYSADEDRIIAVTKTFADAARVAQALANADA